MVGSVSLRAGVDAYVCVVCVSWRWGVKVSTHTRQQPPRPRPHTPGWTPPHLITALVFKEPPPLVRNTMPEATHAAPRRQTIARRIVLRFAELCPGDSCDAMRLLHLHACVWAIKLAQGLLATDTDGRRYDGPRLTHPDPLHRAQTGHLERAPSVPSTHGGRSGLGARDWSRSKHHHRIEVRVWGRGDV